MTGQPQREKKQPCSCKFSQVRHLNKNSSQMEPVVTNGKEQQQKKNSESLLTWTRHAHESQEERGFGHASWSTHQWSG